MKLSRLALRRSFQRPRRSVAPSQTNRWNSASKIIRSAGSISFSFPKTVKLLRDSSFPARLTRRNSGGLPSGVYGGQSPALEIHTGCWAGSSFFPLVLPTDRRGTGSRAGRTLEEDRRGEGTKRASEKEDPEKASS